jgi:small-conductance mechanosensitive channel
VALALLIAVFLGLWIYPARPVAFNELILLLALVPLLRVVPGMMPREMRRPVYILAGLYAFDLLHSMVPAQFLLGRLLLLLETLAALIAMRWLFGPQTRMDNLKAKPLWKVLIRFAPLAFLALAGSIVANVAGAVALAKQLTAACISSANFTIILFVVVALFTSLAAILFQRKSLQALYLIQSYGSVIERRVLNLLWIVAAFIWLRAILKIWGVYSTVANWLATILSQEWVFGAVKFSIMGVLSVLFTLGITLLLARFVRLLLEKEIFVRIRLPRGIPGAISMVVRYAIVGFGIFLAIASTGVDLGKFGLIAGALGVGLGFGLQNVISNFVSGLILAFERPIQVGDSVEVGGVQGKVSQIGVRSSTIATFDGSEVIVPNSNLISNQVSNWTLSDRKRRMELAVKVAFGCDPHQVLDLLASVARQHTGVLDRPEPVAVFNGFGDYYLDFTLYYWIYQDDYQLKTKSEVALGVFDRLRGAGIDTPTPLRNLNLKLLQNEEKGLSIID